jgi:membrane protein DedA with SNARE-associated domain/rhodanese-related sulfurtransferase
VLMKQTGLPLPAVPLLVATGALAAEGKTSFALTLASVIVACVLADSAWYASGRRFGGKLLGVLCRVSISRDVCIRDTQSLYRRVGPMFLLVAKFVPGAGGLTVVMAGLTRLSAKKFLIFDTLGSALWAGAWLLIGGYFHQAFANMIAVIHQYGVEGMEIAVPAFVAYIACKIIRRRRATRRGSGIPFISWQELQGWRDEERHFLLLDVRTLAIDPLPGAVELDPHASIATIEAIFATHFVDAAELFSRDIIVYCDCHAGASAASFARQLRSAGYRNLWVLAGVAERRSVDLKQAA